MKATDTVRQGATALARHLAAGTGAGLRLLVLVTIDHALDTPLPRY
ncbi:hypothetical protein ACQREA_15330 [Dietzia cinnamea]|nr:MULTISPECIES: hypothetical protein [Dietzia]MCT1885323.1 hypothetical protein [Dietzia cinnamea]MCT2300174.1 hypothetical protein [Dietzia cinnamea]